MSLPRLQSLATFMCLTAKLASPCGRLKNARSQRAICRMKVPGLPNPSPRFRPPFARQKFTVDDINPYLDPAEKARIRDILLKASNDGIYTPPAYNRQTIEVPGENGGANQGSTAADPYTGVMYVKTYDAPTIHNMTEAAPVRHLSTTSGTFEERGYALYEKNCVTCHGPNRERITYPKSIDFEKFTAVLRAGNGVMPAFSASTLKPEDILSLAAYLKDPVAGKGNPENPHVNPSAPPPPTGQTRFYGPFGFTFRANNGLPGFSPPWSSLVAYDLNNGTFYGVGRSERHRAWLLRESQTPAVRLLLETVL